jgi:hypothetical protein
VVRLVRSWFSMLSLAFNRAFAARIRPAPGTYRSIAIWQARTGKRSLPIGAA